MYEQNILGKCESQAGMLQRANLTVGENIDSKIAQLQAEIGRLEASKATLGPLLGMKIGDIRDAMSY